MPKKGYKHTEEYKKLQKEKAILWWSKHPKQKEENSNRSMIWWKNHPEQKEKNKQAISFYWKDKPKESKICLVCGKEYFRKTDSNKQWDNRKVCSRECFNISGLNKTGKRIYKKGEENENWKGGKYQFVCLDCGKPIGRNNEHKRCKDCVKIYKKENNLYASKEYHLIRESKEFKDWRDCVFTTDDWVCQKTGQRGGDLEPHHILNFNDYPEERFNPNNGITLSKKAHREFHKIYGVKNNTLEQIKEFLKI